MKEDVKPTTEREKEALEWAIEFFRDLHDEITPEGSTEVGYNPDALIGMYDDRHKDPKWFDDHLAVYFRLSFKGDGSATFNLCCLAATLIERGEPLPKHLRAFAVKFLCLDPIFNPTFKAIGRPKLKKYLAHRDALISEAVEHIAKTWQFPPTRNVATDSPSAASIVRKALKGTGIPLSEKSINRIYGQYGYIVVDSPVATSPGRTQK